MNKEFLENNLREIVIAVTLTALALKEKI